MLGYRELGLEIVALVKDCPQQNKQPPMADKKREMME